jgi:hypothetical protein
LKFDWLEKCHLEFMPMINSPGPADRHGRTTVFFFIKDQCLNVLQVIFGPKQERNGFTVLFTI